MSWNRFISSVAGQHGTALRDIFVRDFGPITAYIRGQLTIIGDLENIGSFDELIALISNDRPRELGLEAHEFAAAIDGNRFRVSYARIHGGRELTLRHIVSNIREPEELLIPEQVVRRFLSLDSGLVIFCGEIGSGKSTSVASLVNKWGQQHAHKIHTIEDPIEVEYPATLANGTTFTQREVGVHCASFQMGLKEARRQGARMIVVGEVRDEETAEQCIRAAMMGTLIVTTIHGADAPEGVRSFLQELPAERGIWGQRSLASSLRLVVAQQLLRNPTQDSLYPIHEVLFNLPDMNERDLGAQSYLAVQSHIRNGELEKLRAAISNNRGTSVPYFMQTFQDSLGHRVLQKQLPRSLLTD